MDNHEVVRVRPASIVAGAILLALGVTMLIDQTHMVPLGVGRIVAPLVLIALGTLIVAERAAFVAGRANGKPRRCSDPSSGIWLIGIGIWMLVSQTHLFGLSYATSWPLFIILSGIIMVVGALTASRTRQDANHD